MQVRDNAAELRVKLLNELLLAYDVVDDLIYEEANTLRVDEFKNVGLSDREALDYAEKVRDKTVKDLEMEQFEIEEEMDMLQERLEESGYKVKLQIIDPKMRPFYDFVEED